jgi:hypothetical protein
VQTREDVNVVFNAVDAVQMGIFVLDDAPDVLIKFRPSISGKGSLPVLG